MDNKKNEIENLERIARDSVYADRQGSAMIRYCAGVFERWIKPGPILELGPAEGIMTDYLVRMGDGCPVTCVDASETFCNSLRKRYPQIEVRQELFEEFVSDTKYQTIVLGHVLEHVEDPVAILKHIAPVLADGGRVLAAVPNSRSVHRQAAVIMGLLEREDQMNDMDRRHGHRRIYNPETLRQDFIASGYEVEFFGGYWMKPVSNGQIQESWSDAMLEAFMQMGERYPDIAAEIYVVARRRG